MTDGKICDRCKRGITQFPYWDCTVTKWLDANINEVVHVDMCDPCYQKEQSGAS